jgi:hypothetical protein
MFGLLEFVFFLYSFADTMIAALVKPFVIQRVTLEMTTCRGNASDSANNSSTMFVNLTDGMGEYCIKYIALFLLGLGWVRRFTLLTRC